MAESKRSPKDLSTMRKVVVVSIAVNLAEKLLYEVDQSPKISMLHALKPSMKALIHEDLLRHSDVDVNVAVASCMCEIVRITAPDAPYDDDQMRAVFQLIVSSFEGLADQSNRSYNKRLSVLENVCKTKAFVIMLDIECDVVIVRMFEHFLRSIRALKVGWTVMKPSLVGSCCCNILLAHSKSRVGPWGLSEGSGFLVPRVEGNALGWFHRAANTSRSRQWKDNELVHPWLK
ncbi:sister chromatid cohesion protein PDS5-like protein isoform X1 [Tanacetum coccineum]|uniref:Sister chromatid cohesion protein PDS5-like protein isoform X1 n=1 Tax=Tanacetum coccineum TaxID=301880 RepID=A0ABQ5GPN1_9ASTR